MSDSEVDLSLELMENGKKEVLETNSDEELQDKIDEKKEKKQKNKKAKKTKKNKKKAKNKQGYDDEDIDAAYKHWDYVISFNDIHPPEHDADEENMKKFHKFKEIQNERRTIIKRLQSRSVGLKISKRKSEDGKSLFVLITASQERLDYQAEKIELPMKLKSEFGGGYTNFFSSEKQHYETDPEDGVFRRTQRIFLIEGILSDDLDDDGAGLNLDALVRDKIISNIFPLHQIPLQKHLIEIWASPKNIFRKQPLMEIRNYFGEGIGLYFAWLGFYTKWLWYASFVGGIFFIPWIIGNAFPSSRYITTWFYTAYAFFLSIWATLFLELWKRRNKNLNYHWGTLKYEENERERPDFYGETREGLYIKGLWVPLDKNNSYGLINIPKSKYYRTASRLLKIAVGVPIFSTLITVVVVLTVTVLSFRIYVENAMVSIEGAIIGSIVNAITIIIMNSVWQKVAIMLTSWENHRTRRDYENALISKIFIFQFINSYISLYYIAFFKNGNHFWGSNNPDLIDACEVGYAPVHIISRACPDELALQLATILGVNMFIGQAKEILIPYVMRYVHLYLQKRDPKELLRESHQRIPQWERESKKPKFPGAFDEYLEMVIQYGYITLFAAAFPIASLMAALNNMIEIRTDAFKILDAYTRPEYYGAQDIGTWYSVLEIIGFFAVITNCALIAFSFSSIYITVNQNAFATLAIAVIIEHILLFLKFLISELIPDNPGWIKKNLARQQYIKEKLLRPAEIKPKVWKVDDPSDDDDDDEDDDEEFLDEKQEV